ncbi:hypothetical protein [Hymenobacter guriensis]|uniref:Uncharacterized protein n=1 Tax=Hymenobacter guriensis TaxID=2793065 RepID=A0ABS0L122_9BACT|nr:hypothetical protein [Hymenobacter guriensis]MBG8553067.1 hypothetical protein [Hymenobacter guriensis]
MPAPALYTDALQESLGPGAYAYASRWGYYEYDKTPISRCFLWKVEERPGGRLVLVAQGHKQTLPLTEARANQLAVLPHWDSRFSLHDYPERWQKLLSIGCGIHLMSSGVDDTLHICTHTKRRIGTVRLEGEELHAALQRPEIFGRALDFVYFCQKHPKKSEGTNISLLDDNQYNLMMSYK